MQDPVENGLANRDIVGYYIHNKKPKGGKNGHSCDVCAGDRSGMICAWRRRPVRNRRIAT